MKCQNCDSTSCLQCNVCQNHYCCTSDVSHFKQHIEIHKSFNYDNRPLSCFQCGAYDILQLKCYKLSGACWIICSNCYKKKNNKNLQYNATVKNLYDESTYNEEFLQQLTKRTRIPKFLSRLLSNLESNVYDYSELSLVIYKTTEYQHFIMQQIRRAREDAQFLPTIADTFPLVLKNVTLNNGQNMVEALASVDLLDGKLQYNKDIQRFVGEGSSVYNNCLNIQISYPQIYGVYIKAEYNIQTMFLQQNAKFIEDMEFRQVVADKAIVQASIPWTRFTTLNGKRVNAGANLLIKVVLNQVIVMKVHSVVSEVKTYLNLQIFDYSFSQLKQLVCQQQYQGLELFGQEHYQGGISFLLEPCNAIVVLKRQQSALSLAQEYLDSKQPFAQLLINGNLQQLQLDLPTNKLQVSIEMNSSQKQCIQQVFKQRISLIQGCPGGGKTRVAAEISSVFLKSQKQKILCCSGSNTAADNIAEACLRLNLRVLRIFSATKEKYDIEHLNISVGLEKRVFHIILRERLESKYYVLAKIIDEQENIALIAYINHGWKKYQDKHPKTRIDPKKIIYQILDYEQQFVDVVICTCATSFDTRLEKSKYGLVILDESMHCIEPEQLMGVLHAEHCVLIGDEKQLGPVLRLKHNEGKGLDKGLFQRMINIGIIPVQLDIQYRMHPRLMDFCNSKFYGDQIKDGVTAEQRLLERKEQYNVLHGVLKPEFPSFFWHIQGLEETYQKSFKNEIEAQCILELIRAIIAAFKIREQDIAVITPYSAQVICVAKVLGDANFDKISVETVDGFQGREQEIIIYSCVRSNANQTIGFVRDQRRVNVALTRARRASIIIGDVQTLKADETIWNEVCQYYFGLKQLYEGKTVSSLQVVKTLGQQQNAEQNEFDYLQDEANVVQFD